MTVGLSRHEAALECLELALEPIVAAMLVGPNEDQAVNFYKHKSQTLSKDRASIQRPCVIVQHFRRGSAHLPQIAGPYPYLARVGAAVYVEAPLSVSVSLGAGSYEEYSGRDTMLQPICYTLEEWFRDNASVTVPDAVRYVGGNPANTEVFPYDAIDIRAGAEFVSNPRDREYETAVYYPILEFIEVQ